jgi:pseudouridylate synthase
MLKRLFSSRPALPPWPRFNVSPEIRKALVNGDPVVALESTIISHGMPYPRNVAVANQVEAVVRNNGAIPATIAIIDGIITVGASQGDIERLGNPETAKTVVKASRRDLGPVVAQARCASTTVAATMYVVCSSLVYGSPFR